MYATLIAKEFGMEQNDLYILEKAAALHDIGKIGIRDAVLQKEGNALGVGVGAKVVLQAVAKRICRALLAGNLVGVRHRLKAADNVSVIGQLVCDIGVRVKADGNKTVLGYHLFDLLQKIKLSRADLVNLHTAVEEDVNAVCIGMLANNLHDLLRIVLVDRALNRSRGKRNRINGGNRLNAVLKENILHGELLENVLTLEIFKILLLRMISRAAVGFALEGGH